MEINKNEVQEILAKALELKRLSIKEAKTLIQVKDPELNELIFESAYKVKNSIYGNRIVFFAPLYISNYCVNNCLYCGFRVDNQIRRHFLHKEEIENDTLSLLKQGHKRVLLVAGEAYPKGKGLDYILDSIKTIYDTKYNNNNIRRINVNIAPLDKAEFKELKAANIGTYQLFQETYHRPTYQIVHPKGPKSNYDDRLAAIDRAFEAGIDDLGIGVLFGLADWRYETLALLEHVEHLEKKFGMGPHTISVPRLEPTFGSDLASNSKNKVSDQDFKKIIAILRLAVPYTGLILSTRENPQMRREALKLGISQISAGSKTNPGGYSEQADLPAEKQFSLGDHRTLDEVIEDLLDNGFLPSFCTACYRLGRTGLDFMEYAKPGQIKKKCEPNAILTFQEYLNEFASPQVKQKGQKLIQNMTADINDSKLKNFMKSSIKKIKTGEKDIYI